MTGHGFAVELVFSRDGTQTWLATGDIDGAAYACEASTREGAMAGARELINELLRRRKQAASDSIESTTTCPIRRKP